MQTITTLSDLTSALVMAGHQRIDGDSLTWPKEGPSLDEVRWNCYPEINQQVMLFTGVPVVGGKPVGVYICCGLDGALEKLTHVAIFDKDKRPIAWIPWQQWSLNFILQTSRSLFSSFLMIEGGIEPWIEARPRVEAS